MLSYIKDLGYHTPGPPSVQAVAVAVTQRPPRQVDHMRHMPVVMDMRRGVGLAVVLASTEHCLVVWMPTSAKQGRCPTLG